MLILQYVTCDIKLFRIIGKRIFQRHIVLHTIFFILNCFSQHFFPHKNCQQQLPRNKTLRNVFVVESCILQSFLWDHDLALGENLCFNQDLFWLSVNIFSIVVTNNIFYVFSILSLGEVSLWKYKQIQGTFGGGGTLQPK